MARIFFYESVGIGKPTGNRILGRPRLRWEDSLRMDLKEICINTRNWVDSAQVRYYWRALQTDILAIIPV